MIEVINKRENDIIKSIPFSVKLINANGITQEIIDNLIENIDVLTNESSIELVINFKKGTPSIIGCTHSLKIVIENGIYRDSYIKTYIDNRWKEYKLYKYTEYELNDNELLLLYNRIAEVYNNELAQKENE